MSDASPRIPTAPRRLPGLGHAIPIFRDPLGFLTSLRKLGPLVKIWIGPMPFIPFSAGARKCIGDTFATIEASLALATITVHWELKPIPGTRVHPTPAITLGPRGLRMHVSVRNGHDR